MNLRAKFCGKWLSFYLAITDYLIIVGSFAVIVRLRFMPHIDIIDLRTLTILPAMLLVLLGTPVALLIFGAVGLYQRKTLLSRTGHALAIVQGMSFLGVAYIILAHFLRTPLFMESRLVVLTWVAASIVLLMLNRLAFLPSLYKVCNREEMQRRVVLIGLNDIAKRVAEIIRSGRGYTGVTVVGVLTDKEPVGADTPLGVPCLGPIAALTEIVSAHQVEGAIITNPDLSYQQLMDLMEQCVRLFGWVDVHTAKSAVLHQSLDVDTYLEIPFVRMGRIPSGPLIRIYKRTVDLVGASIGVIVFSPLLLAIAISIKLTSPGPVLYVSERVGYRGSLFRFYKFRSMRIGADREPERREAIVRHIRDESVVANKLVNRSLVTPVGRFLRKWALDELPQLFNVIKGDMSLVGPRPVPREEYDACDEWQKRRFDIKPGCTGLWKLFAASQQMPFSHTVLYDIYYARNMNPLLDIYILLGTVRLILLGRADS